MRAHWLMAQVGGGGEAEGEACVLRSPGFAPSPISLLCMGGVCGRSLTAGKILFTGRQTCSLYLVLWLCATVKRKEWWHVFSGIIRIRWRTFRYDNNIRGINYSYTTERLLYPWYSSLNLIHEVCKYVLGNTYGMHNKVWIYAYIYEKHAYIIITYIFLIENDTKD